MCNTCFQRYMDVRIARIKFPIVIDFDELGGLKDWHLEGEELEAYLYGEMDEEIDIWFANQHLHECRTCRLTVAARTRELEALGREALLS